MWVPANWVAAGLTGLPDIDVEIVALGRDMGQTGDVGDVDVPASAADVVPASAVARVARRARPAVAGQHSETGQHNVAGLSDLPDLLPEADVVVLLVPATPATTGMVDGGFLADMKDGALLVNAARGTVVDTAALVAEVASGRLRAALDVTDPELLPSRHPLWPLPCVFITPHVAASTPVSRRRAAQLVREQAQAYARGEPLRNVISGAY